MKFLHGGNIIATAKELGLPISSLIDMSSNLAPLETDPDLLKELRERLSEISYLPETDSETLRELFAEKYKLNTGQVLVGNGTTDFIYAIPQLMGISRALIINPTYSDYVKACRNAAITPESYLLSLDSDFELNLEQLSRKLLGEELVFICNPNNPTGILKPTVELHNFIKEHKSTLFVIDETYLPFIREKSLVNYFIPENLFVLRSFSKVYGIPGLRLGFLVSNEQSVAKIRNKSKPWGVNRLAQIAGEYIITKGDQYDEAVVRFLEEERQRFVQQLSGLSDVEVIPGNANYILCRLTGEINAEELRIKMLDQRFMIRNCSNFEGLDDTFFRLSLKSKQLNSLCIKTLQNILTQT